ncbi:MAG: indolepyruvate oxidoreductase subunit beta [Alphaproteobacteria bacterium]|nr:indolepyruvate oxidoreductase subunit beta [Alphaproteobacteria bacterium]
MSDVVSIMLVGVGGQGTVLVTAILSEGLVGAGYDVKMSEVHGMSQRGGSVSTQVRYGRKVHSPIVGVGGADILVAFEKMEALRWLEYLKPKGSLIVNDFEIPSVPVLLGRQAYPRGILEGLAAQAATTVVGARDIAAGIGDTRVMNVVLFGALIETIGLYDIDWDSVIGRLVKPAFLQQNLAAYRAGRRAVARQVRVEEANA